MCVNCIYWVSNKELVAEMWKVISNWLLLADISSVEQRTGNLFCQAAPALVDIYLEVTVAGPGHDEGEGGPHRLALPVEVVFGHLVQDGVGVPHLAVDLLREGERLLRRGEHRLLHLLRRVLAHGGQPGNTSR